MQIYWSGCLFSTELDIFFKGANITNV